VEAMAKALQEALVRSLQDLKKISTDDLVHNRYSKYRKIGKFYEAVV